MWLLEEKMDAVEDKEKWWIIELPMRRAWKRIYIPLSPCRLGNYLLILRRMAPMVVSLNLPIFCCFFSLRKGFWMSSRPLKGIPAGHLDPFCCSVTVQSKMRIWTPLPAQTWAADYWASRCAFEDVAQGGQQQKHRRSMQAECLGWTIREEVSFLYIQYTVYNRASAPLCAVFQV